MEKKHYDYDAIIIPGGGLTADGRLPEWVERRLKTAIAIYHGGPIIALSAGTAHVPMLSYANGFPRYESFVMADFLTEHGIPADHILREWTSYDTIGNFYFTRLLHTDQQGWRRLMIVNSEFHMPRTQAIAKWIFSLDNPQPTYKLEFITASDEGLDRAMLAPRVQKEKKRLQALNELRTKITTLAEFHRWLYSDHAMYATRLKSQVYG